MKSPQKKIPATSFASIALDEVQFLFEGPDPHPLIADFMGCIRAMADSTLHSIIKYKIPLQKLAQYELMNRGFDHHFNFIGFKEAEDHWKKIEEQFQAKGRCEFSVALNKMKEEYRHHEKRESNKGLSSKSNHYQEHWIDDIIDLNNTRTSSLENDISHER